MGKRKGTSRCVDAAADDDVLRPRDSLDLLLRCEAEEEMDSRWKRQSSVWRRNRSDRRIDSGP